MSHHNAQHEHERKVKTYIATAAIWVCVVAAGFWFYRVGKDAHKAANHHQLKKHGHKSTHSAIDPRKRRRGMKDGNARREAIRRALSGRRVAMAKRAGAKNMPDFKQRRLMEVQRWQKRMRNKGFKLSATANGAEHDAFNIKYEKSDRFATKHLEELKNSKGFQSYLRRFRFSRVSAAIGNKQVFSVKL